MNNNNNKYEENKKKQLCFRQDEKEDLKISTQMRKACKKAKALIMENYNYTEADNRRTPIEGGKLGENVYCIDNYKEKYRYVHWR